MSRPSGVRRIAKWFGVVVCAVLVAVGWASLHYHVTYAWGGTTYIEIAQGTFFFLDSSGQPRTIVNSSNSRWGPGVYVLTTAQPPQGFSYSTAPPSATARWLPRLDKSFGTTTVRLPLWIPFILIALPTGYLFWRDRRHPRGHCQGCGYDLTGNESGVCSECGRTV